MDLEALNAGQITSEKQDLSHSLSTEILDHTQILWKGKNRNG